MADNKRTARRSGGVRWWIVWTLFFSTVTNYISRQTFSVLAPVITAQYQLTHTDLAKILGAFQLSYAVTWLLGGIFLDAIGTRLGLAASTTAAQSDESNASAAATAITSRNPRTNDSPTAWRSRSR